MISRERLRLAHKKALKTFRKYHGCAPEHHEFSGRDWAKPGGPVYRERDPEWLVAVLGKYRKTTVFCSDPRCCGNPRRLHGNGREGRTIQERRHGW